MFSSSVGVVKKVSVHPVLGKTINMVAVDRNCTIAIVATRDSCSAARYSIRCHISQRLFKCFHGKCQRRYKYPQDLDRHIAMHSVAKFDCDLCDKTFSQKRLLKRHSVVHLNVCAYKCSNCNESFKHYNQLYRHRKRCP